MAYVTVTEYKAWLNALLIQRNQTAPSVAAESEYEVFLDEATALIESETKRKFTATTETRYYNKKAQDRGNLLVIFTPDLLTVTGVVNGDGKTLAESDYWAYPRNGARKFGVEIRPSSSVAWQFTPEYVAVTGTWGVMVEPDNYIKRLTMRVAWYIQQSRTFTGQVTTFGDGTRQHEAAMPQDIARDLKRLTMPEVV